MRQVLRFDASGNAQWVDPRDAKPQALRPPKPTLSDALGCIPTDVSMLQADAAAGKFGGVEFVPDHGSAENDGTLNFYHCKLSGSPAERQRYIEHRGMVDKTGKYSGVTVSPDELAAAERLAKERYGTH